MKETVENLRHLGLILDGNRRWAKKSGKTLLEGHRQGAEVFKDLSLHMFENKNIEYVTAYVFSAENWSRTKDEVSYLMRLVIRAFEKHLDEFNKRGIKIKIIGRRNRLDTKVLKVIESAEKKTKDNPKGTLVLCLNYSGKQEIVDACKKIVKNSTKPDEIDEETITKSLYAADIPPIDLLIRTSGEKRLSNFMLWRIDYAELFFTETLWPDMTKTDIDEIIEEYSNRQRRFGQ